MVILASAATVVMSLAITYNALFAQPGHSNSGLASDTSSGASTHMEVSASSAARTTIQLRYDPVAEDVQRELQAAGFYKGPVDGVVGRRTRDAIAAYQKANGLEVTGIPSPNLIEHIRYTRQIAEASLFTGSVDPAPDAEQRAEVRRVQTALSELAYYQGEISGEMGRPTEIAIRQFEHDHGLAESGAITDALLAELGKVSGQTEAVPQ